MSDGPQPAILIVSPAPLCAICGARYVLYPSSGALEDMPVRLIGDIEAYAPKLGNLVLVPVLPYRIVEHIDQGNRSVILHRRQRGWSAYVGHGGDPNFNHRERLQYRDWMF